MIFDNFGAQDVPLTTRYYGARARRYGAVDVPLSTQYRGYVSPSAYLGFGDAWTDWCDQRYGPSGSQPDAGALPKCKVTGFFAPWTIFGRAERGLPPDKLPVAGPAAAAAAPSAAQPGGTFAPVSGAGLIGGLSTNVLLIGAGLLGVGVLLTLRKKRGKR